VGTVQRMVFPVRHARACVRWDGTVGEDIEHSRRRQGCDDRSRPRPPIVFTNWRLIHKPPEKSGSSEPDGSSAGAGSQFLHNR
jgi:hypothetical protein